MQARFIRSIDEIDCARWNQLCGTDYPFLRHEFFTALEHSGSTTPKTGWSPNHLLIEEDQKLVGIVPLFVKTHSYGEYVFDWSWADAYHQHGLNYYPKLLAAIPFTPATGPRWGLSASIDQNQAFLFIKQTLAEHCQAHSYSSFHCLFTQEVQTQRLAADDMLIRTGCQYHWFNHDYQDFDDFLAHFNSRKRKNVKKERRKVLEQGITIEIKTGDAISALDWENFYRFYHLTYLKRSGREGYLTPQFFPLIAESMAEHLVLIQAFKEDQAIGAALCFKSSDTLFGRYWGCAQEFEFLHFEACYYQGIEYAIKHGLKRFDPGAQGEHKIQRGFAPITTYSSHWLANPSFHDAVANFLTKEQAHIDHYIEEAKTLLPFKEELS